MKFWKTVCNTLVDMKLHFGESFIFLPHIRNSSKFWMNACAFAGILGCVWFLIWIFIASDKPEEHKFISQEERKYIVESRNAKFAIRKVGHSLYKTV